MGPRGRRDQTAGGGMAETRRRKCHSCREWMEETRKGILLREEEEHIIQLSLTLGRPAARAPVSFPHPQGL